MKHFSEVVNVSKSTEYSDKLKSPRNKAARMDEIPLSREMSTCCSSNQSKVLRSNSFAIIPYSSDKSE